MPEASCAGVGGAAGEHRDDGILRDRQQPPLDQDQAAGEPLRVGDVQRGGVVRLLPEAERRVAVGAQGGLRRGEPLAEFAYAGFFDAERARLDELTLVATESRAGADLALGRHGELAGELQGLCREHPLRERLWELFILALYRSGRQAEALRAYAEVRDHLAGELGLDPGPALRELQARILAQDPSLGPASDPASPAPAQLVAPPEEADHPRDSLLPAPLLETKFYVPRSRRGLVPRPRLIERLDRGTELKLTLVSAPAGFGKTTLLTEWLAAGPAAPADERLVAWLSLGRADNDPASFWTYVIAALRTVAAGVGESVLPLLQAPQPSPIETVLTVLLNDLGTIAADIVLVLDDYHVIDASDVQDGMAFLLDHLPPWLHVVIASRADPALPLARWRARGELVEIRAAELRFTPDEAAAYLNEIMGLQLTARDVAALEGRTEGWIAALQLAALSMQGRDDVAGFIAGFAGDDRYVVDYLAEEVLQRQPDRVQAFLLQTSILGRLSGPLCDAVTGQSGSKAMLEALDRGNLFLVPLDDRRRWYRYHQLFADVLNARLLDEQPGQVPDLHRRASAWYQQNGEPSEAISHALAAEDFERAADLVELAIPAMRRTRQEATLRGWLKALPDELFRVRPVLSVGFAGALLAVGELEGVEARLRDAMSEVYRERDDLHAATQHLLRSQELGEHIGLPQNRYRWRVAMARIRQAEGDLAGALDLLNEAERLYVGDFFPNVRPVPAVRARVWIAQGRLGEALGWAHEQGLSVADDLSYLREFEHITLARVLLARYQDERAEASIHEATQLLERLLLAAEEGERTGRVIEILVLQALARRRLGDIPAALACLERAVTLAEPEGYVRVFADEGPPMASLLRALAKRGTAGNYARRLLAAMGETGHDSPVKQALIEPLSERELDVLRLLGSELDGPAIARELTVSLNTMRTHTKNIYAKLFSCVAGNQNSSFGLTGATLLDMPDPSGNNEVRTTIVSSSSVTIQWEAFQ